MNIRTQQHLSAGIAGVILLAMGATLLISSHLARQAAARHAFATDIVLAVSQLRFVAFEYVQSHEARPRMQWQQRHESLATLLANDIYRGTAGDPIVEHLRRRNVQMKDVFGRLVRNFEAPGRGPEAIDLTQRLEARLVSEFLEVSQDIAASVARLAHASDAEAITALRRETLFLVAALAVMGAMVAINLLLVRRRILAPIARLAHGAALVGEGDLGFRTGIAGGDEIGELAARFDAMTARLQAAITALNGEIEQRGKAAGALKKASAELTRSNAELAQFAYVASHDLQEPLRMVTDYVQLLEKRLAGRLDVETREFMGYAVDGAQRMHALIEDILAYSRVGSEGRPPQAVDSGAALEEACARLAGRIAETGAEVAAQPLPTVVADRAQLVQLFQNLVGNAIKYCKGRAPRVRVEARGEEREWRFSVTDNGIGIDPQYGERVFGIFQRLHTRREYPGTGIGLAICKNIVERHGGWIGVEPAPGGGSVFWFTLPRHA